MASLQKNIANQNVTFCLVRAADGGASTSTSTTIIVGFVSKDGTQASAGGTFASLGSGQWNYGPTQAETNATDVGIYITTSGSSCIPSNLDFHTDQVDANGFLKVDLVDIAGSATVGTAGYVGIDWSAINAPTSSQILSGTTIGTLTALSATGQSSLADAILNRDMSVGLDSGSSSVRTPRQAFRVLRNKVDTSSGSSLVVYKEDDATQSWTASITVSSAAQPIVTVTPP